MPEHEIDTLGPYRIEAVLGRGAMGVVYRAHTAEGGRPLAIKTLRRDLATASDEQAVIARFQMEARIGMAFDHPNIIKVRDYGEAGGLAYMAMDFIEGQDLKELLVRQPPLGVDEVVHLILQLLDALNYAHRRRVVHRDIKPANVRVRQDASIVLTDFGVAHVAASELTQTGDMIGTPAYMAPEQLQGHAVDHRADMFSVGVLLYQMLTRKRPFDGSLAAVMQQLIFVDPPLPSTVAAGIPPAFDAVIMKALAKQPEQRFATAAEFAAALRTAAERSRGYIGTAAPAVRPLGESEAPADGGERVAASAVSTDSGVKRALDRLEASIEAEIREALGGETTGRHLDRLTAWLDDFVLLSQRLGGQPNEDRLVRLIDGRVLPGLADRIVKGAPIPGRESAEIRGDWLFCVRLFRSLHGALDRLAAARAGATALERIKTELAGVFFGYSATLSRLLFSEDDPDILRISLDFMRLDAIQLALEELDAGREVAQVRSSLVMFASQVMQKVNAIVRQFTQTGDALARFGVANLLVEIEELIVIAERLVEKDMGIDLPGSAVTAGIGREVIAEFIANARKLAQLTVDEVIAETQQGQADVGSFTGKLKQLGFLYLFATRLDDQEARPLLHDLVTEVHDGVVNLAKEVVGAAQAAISAGRRDEDLANRIDSQLAALYDLCQDFGWLDIANWLLMELRKRVLQDR